MPSTLGGFWTAWLAAWIIDSVVLVVQAQESGNFNESSVFLNGEAFSKDEGRNTAIMSNWLDDIFWSDLWYQAGPRNEALSQILDLATLTETHLPQLAFSVGQVLYSYFWFKDNSGKIDIEIALRIVKLHELALNHSGCNNLTQTIGGFIGNVCHDRWFFVLMLNAEVGAELAKRRSDVGRAARLLHTADHYFRELIPYPYFSFRNWDSLYDLNTNANVFDGAIKQRPIWSNEGIPLAKWLEANAHIFKADLEYIIQNNLFDTLYFQGRVSMTQFSGKRESWAPLSLIHNKTAAPYACEVARRTCDLLLTRPEIARCSATDVGMTYARLRPGHGIKPHFWSAPPRLGIHLGLITPPGASMWVGSHQVAWKEGQAVVFDDTYIHSVQHTGNETRYLLAGWFCHPCDNFHAEVPASDPMGLCSR